MLNEMIGANEFNSDKREKGGGIRGCGGCGE